MITWKLQTLDLKLQYTWKISRNASNSKQNFIVHATAGKRIGLGEIAPNIRYGETADIIQSEFQTFINAGANNVDTLAELTLLLDSIPMRHALRFGIESAYIHLHCALHRIPVSEFLRIPPCVSKPTMYSLPIMHTSEMKEFYEAHQLQRFDIIKLKVNAENMVDVVTSVSQFCNKPICIDANEAYQNPDMCLRDLMSISDTSLLFIEQPFPAAMADAYRYFKPLSPFPVMADESVTRFVDFDTIEAQFHGINMKLMKAGGYMKGVELLQQARVRNLKTMIGCMIETSVGISSALHLCALADYADLDGFLVIKDEPFHQVSEQNGMLSLRSLS